MSSINTEVKNPEVLRAPYFRDIGTSLLLFLASRASVYGAFPFGIAMFCSCFDKGIAYIGITVMCIAFMSAGIGMAFIKYLIAGLLFWIFSKIYTKNNNAIKSAACGASVFIGGMAMLIYTYVGIYDFFILFTESLISAIMYIIFLKAKNVPQKKRQQVAQDELVSAAVCIGIFITGLSGITLPLNISVSNIASVYAVMFIALNGSLAAAGCGGLCIGFMASLSSPYAVAMTGIYGLSALFGNMLKSFSKFGTALGFVGGIAIAIIYCSGTLDIPITFLDAAIGAVLFTATPRKIHSYISTFFSKSIHIEAVETDVRMKEYLSLQLENTAKSFKSLEECFVNASDKRLRIYNKEAGELFDEVSDRVCTGCGMAPKCWQTNFNQTYKNMMSLLGTIETNGVLTISSVPMQFRERCIRTEKFVSEFNHVYELYKNNTVHTGEAVMGRDLVARQYRELYNIMNTMSKEIENGFTFREEDEEGIVSELDKCGITCYEVSVIENKHGKLEIYLRLNIGADIERVEIVLSNMLNTGIGFSQTMENGILKFMSVPKYRIETGVKQISRNFGEISGDSLEVFTTEDYKSYIILSDGMGSGRSALFESNLTINLLHEFLESGFGIKTSVNMINSALCLKLDYESFSTIDLLCIDLMSGAAEFFKIGSAPSLVYHKNEVESVFAVSVPAGILPDVKIQGQSKRLEENDIVLMMSDGVTEAGYGSIRTEWLKKQIKTPYENMDDMAQDIIETAIKKNRDGVFDDMTVIAVRLVEN